MEEDELDFQASTPGEQGAGAAGLGSILLQKAIRLLLSGRQVQAIETKGLANLHKFEQAVLLDELWDIGENVEPAEPARRTVDLGAAGTQLVHVGFGSRGATFTPGRIELNGEVTVAEIPLAAVVPKPISATKVPEAMEALEHQGTMRERRGAETLRRQTQMLGLRIWFLLWKHLLVLDSLLDTMEMSRRSLLVRHLV